MRLIPENELKLESSTEFQHIVHCFKENHCSLGEAADIPNQENPKFFQLHSSEGEIPGNLVNKPHHFIISMSTAV